MMRRSSTETMERIADIRDLIPYIKAIYLINSLWFA